MGEYVVVAEFRLKPGAAAAFHAAMDRHAANSRAEPGCLGFDVCVDSEDAHRVLLFEVYRDAEAYAAHRATESWKSITELLPSLLEPGPDGAIFQRRSVMTRRPRLG